MMVLTSRWLWFIICVYFLSHIGPPTARFATLTPTMATISTTSSCLFGILIVISRKTKAFDTHILFRPYFLLAIAITLSLLAIVFQDSLSLTLDSLGAAFFGMSTTAFVCKRPSILQGRMDASPSRQGFKACIYAALVMGALLFCSSFCFPGTNPYHFVAITGGIFSGTCSFVARKLDPEDPDDEEPGERYSIRATANDLLHKIGISLVGVVLLCFFASLHTGAYIDSLSVSTHFLSVPIWGAFDPMIATFLLFLLGGSLLSYALISIRPERLRPYLACLLVFYCFGVLFVIPPLLNLGFVESTGVMQATMLVYLVWFCVLSERFFGFDALAGDEVSMMFAFWLFLSANIGFLVGVLLDAYLNASYMATSALTCLCILVIVQCPLFLFKSRPHPEDAPPRSDSASLSHVRAKLGESSGLTRREIDVFELLARGYSTPTIAETLYISENTVKVHTRNLYRKLDIHSKQELITIVEGLAKNVSDTTTTPRQ